MIAKQTGLAAFVVNRFSLKCSSISWNDIHSNQKQTESGPAL